MAYKKYFTLSYDDGVLQDRRLVEIFNRYNLKCTFNVNSGFLGTDNTLIRLGKPVAHNKISPDEVSVVYAGHEVATHAKTHPDLTKISDSQVRMQIKDDMQALSELAGYEVVGHAYPGGTYDRRTADILADCGIRYARTIDSTGKFLPPDDPMMWHPTCHHGDEHIFELLQNFIDAQATDGDLLFYLWGHSYEFDFNVWGNNWEHIEKVCSMIAGKEDIVYCTNIEFLNR
ncbi:MAG: polysaccharide deacetylase family protein [Clostridia bacterium]|nr:polysaccharide deacetylase family protein [Clostridia bacterium]